MARDILSEFGPESPMDQKPRATNGGQMEVKPCSYSPPVGPSGINHEGVGLGGTNHGNSCMQGKH